MARADTNARHAADSHRRLDRAILGLMAGVAGWWQLDLAAQGGVLAVPLPSSSGCGWDAWLAQHDMHAAGPVSVLEWPSADQEHYYAAVLLLSQLIDRLTIRPDIYGSGWIRLAGDGRRLLKPTCDVRETLTAALVPG